MLAIFSLIRLQADYLLVIGVCLTLSIANIVGFTKCRKGVQVVFFIFYHNLVILVAGCGLLKCLFPKMSQYRHSNVMLYNLRINNRILFLINIFVKGNYHCEEFLGGLGLEIGL